MSTSRPVVAVGVDLLADAIAEQAVPVNRVEWRPPMTGTESDLATLAADPLRHDANARAVAAMLATTAVLVDVAPASEVLGLSAASSCTPARPSPGIARPGRCGAP